MTRQNLNLDPQAPSDLSREIRASVGAAAASGGRPGELEARLTASGKATPCHIPTYTGISRDNQMCDLSLDIPV